MTITNSHSMAFFNKHRNALICLFLFIAILSAYLPAIKGGYIWDDPMHVTENSLLKNSDGLRRIWFEPGAWAQYYPLTLTSFWVEYHIWGLNPFGYHLVNVLLHVLNVVLLWRVLLWLHVPGALFAAAVFALHPVHVESVAWISERKNVLSGFFYLSALSVYLRFALRDNGIENVPATPGKNSIQPSGRYYKGLYILSLGLYLCALLSKTVTCSLPAVVLLLLWWKRDRFVWRDVQALIPMFLAGVTLGINTIYMEKFRAGAQGTEWAFSFADRCLIAGRALWFYVGKLAWPDNLTFIYPRWQIDSGLWWQYLYTLAALAVMFSLWMLRGRIGKAPIVTVLIFSGTLLPALGFFNLYPMRYSFVADHFQYLASISLIVLFASMATTLFQKYFNGQIYLGLVGSLAVLVLLGMLTFKQGYIYKDVETLYRDTIAKNSQSSLAHNNLGLALYNQGRTAEAIEHYLQALRIKPDYEKVHINLGVALENQGRTAEAIEHYLQALRIKPEFAGAHYNLGLAMYSQDRTAEAIEHYLQALRIRPDYAEAHYNLGLALYSQDRTAEAIEHYLQALRIKPDDVDAHNNLGAVLFRKGNIEGAIAHFRKALRINPGYVNAKNNLKKALMMQQQNK